MKSVKLFFTQGSSDKEYRAELKKSGNGYVVNFAYGRRGQTLRAGSKTPSPVDQEKAEAIYQKLVLSKTSKGYTPDASGEAYLDTDKSGDVSGYNCQLLNPVDSIGRYVRDSRYIAQEKFDGVRQLLQKSTDSEVRGINRKGLFVSIPESLFSGVAALDCDSCALDGEGMGNINKVFDILELDGLDLRSLSYAKRLLTLESLIKASDSALQVVETAYSVEDKQALFDRVKSEGGEGVVFKRINSAYSAGRPSSGGDHLKFKNYATCSVLVDKHNENRRSVAVRLHDGTGLGNVTIPPNANMPGPGSVVEVRYLYAYRGGSLYQPTYLGKRTDIDPDACVLSQLKFKAEPLAA